MFHYQIFSLKKSISNEHQTSLKSVELNSLSDPIRGKTIFEILQDPTRFKIFLFLLIQDELTLLTLAQRINKSKTTIFHHMKTGFGILEEEPELIKWVEKEEGRRLKTKYFSLNRTKKNWKNEIDTYLNSTIFLKNLIQFSEEQGVNLDQNYVKTTVEISQNTKPQTVKIHTHVTVPIDDILKEIFEKLKD